MASLDDSKAEDIVAVDLKGKTEIADFMVVATGTSSRHVSSIASSLIKDLKQHNIKGIEPEGMNEGEWVLIDAGDIIAHVFKAEAREKYDLESMWSVPRPKAEKA